MDSTKILRTVTVAGPPERMGEVEGMKVTNVRACKFSCTVDLKPGDVLTVIHKWESIDEDTLKIVTNEEQLVKHVVDKNVSWTHSILFDLDGELNHLIGTQKTVDWLEELEGEEYVPSV